MKISPTLYEFLRKRHLEDIVQLRKAERSFEPDSVVRRATRQLRREIQTSLAELRIQRRGYE